MKPPVILRSTVVPLLLAAGLFTAACARNAVLESTPVDPALLNPATNSAIRPEPRPGNWMQRHEGFVAEAKRGGIDVLFVGDSITDFWRNAGPRGGRAVWDREFAPLHAANFGISGDRTQHILWRLEHGEVDGLDPKVVVLMIGTNNTGLERDGKTVRNTPDQTVEGVKAVVHAIRTRLPHSRLLLLAIFPRAEALADAQRVQIDYINEQIAPLADGKIIRYLDLGPRFLAPNRTLSKDIFPDLLHPNQKGYEIWAEAVKPLIVEMLNKPRP